MSIGRTRPRTESRLPGWIPPVGGLSFGRTLRIPDVLPWTQAAGKSYLVHTLEKSRQWLAVGSFLLFLLRDGIQLFRH